MPDLADISELRRYEFSRLAATGTVYLDYTGSALYPASLVCRDMHRLTQQVLGNPHSDSAPSAASTDAIETARAQTLRFVDADPAVYDVVFTSNASGAMRILADSFPFRAGSRLVLTADNHNSVNGLTVTARRKRAAVEHVPLNPELRALDPTPWLTQATAPSLFAFPAQSNFSGVRHPLQWIAEAQDRGYRVLLDAAAFAPAHRLSLRATPADFVALSYYKLFGYPTGIGALIARRDALAELRARSYFGGGTVEFVSVQNGMTRLKAGAEGWEDGTPNFLAMPAICDGLSWLESVGVNRIRDHVASLTNALLERLSALGDRVVIHGPAGTEARGGTIAFNLRRAGQWIPFEIVESAARARGLAIRGGCFCNPGAAEHAFQMPARKARRCLRGEFSIARFRECLGDGPVGAIRASMGIASSIEDVDALTEFVAELTA
ncbi:MAG TPA: aminotransferase class V-fold PLP-dependent enzyme [Bryobacteraceae bacterium]|jgi:selenocysteine lyase/cysteine desulfurase